jgi:FtsP/CotA-like multicopper oxidase with cupredoxin domain
MIRMAFKNGTPVLLLVMMMFSLLLTVPAHAVINGETGALGAPVFNFAAKDGHIRTGDGDSVYMWGYAKCGFVNCSTATMQYPGPTLIVTEGDTVTVNLTNRLPLPVSLVFPGHSVTATTLDTATLALVPDTVGLLTKEVPPDKEATTVSYTFTAGVPGTYTYYSGTQSDLEVEMGLVGALIVRPATFNPATPGSATGGRIAYNDPPVTLPAPGGTAPISSYDREYLFLLTEVDADLHKKVEQGGAYLADTTNRHTVSFFINGRTFPDTMAMDNAHYLPNQPYNCMPEMHPGERVLMRMIGAGRDLHPYHTHGQNHLVVARDGRLLNDPLTAAGTPNLAVSDFTTTVVPGETVDAVWGPWTGARLGWDVYGPTPHTCTNPTGFDPVTFEYCPDHNKPFPVQLPAQSDLTFGPMYGGTPFLGVPGSLPPVNVQQNPLAGLSYMWHSHAERELTTNNIFIGGMATMSLVLPCACNGTTIPCTQTNCPFIDEFKP